MPAPFSGALQSKKKSDLQEIATAMRISDQGTKDELQGRIKKYMDNNQSDLEDDPKFSGLFGRRKRSVQPPASRFAPDPVEPKESPSRSIVIKSKIIRMEPIGESTPAKDLRDVSMYLKNSPLDKSPVSFTLGTPSSLPPLPPSPADRSIIDHLPRPPDVDTIVQSFKHHEEVIVQNGSEMLVLSRVFLSNSRNLWSLTALAELLYILGAVIPWKTVDVGKPDSFTLRVLYPPVAVFQSADFWTVILHWFIPTLLIPTVFGLLISFHPAKMTRPNRLSAPAAPFDPLTASIVRLASHVAYPYPSIDFDKSLDILGIKWRVLSASLGVAFAFAEAIALAPEALANHLSKIDQNPNSSLTVRSDVDDDE
ncbi:hypothetical protein C8J56DRAFT_1027401 [Mycena floridula]|nr:hypothetical protein C8J56DRAFT_1027401 [Mycena floridula]